MSEAIEYFEIPEAELQFSFARSSGPGGQNVNKVNSKAILHWAVAESSALPFDVKARFLKAYQNRLKVTGELVLSSDRFRDQGRNMSDCREKLYAMIEAVAKPPKLRKATRPSKASKERRITAKKKQGEKKAMRRFDY